MKIGVHYPLHQTMLEYKEYLADFFKENEAEFLRYITENYLTEYFEGVCSGVRTDLSLESPNHVFITEDNSLAIRGYLYDDYRTIYYNPVTGVLAHD